MSKESKKAKSADKNGSVCVFYGGIIKAKTVRIGFAPHAKPTDLYQEAQVNYGKYITCKYVQTDDPESMFEKLKKQLEEQLLFHDIYDITPANILEILRKISGGKTISLNEKQAKHSTKGKSKDKKQSNKDDDTDQTDTNTEPETKTKKGKGSQAQAAAAQAQSESSSEEEEEETQKKTVTKSKKSAKIAKEETPVAEELKVKELKKKTKKSESKPEIVVDAKSEADSEAEEPKKEIKESKKSAKPAKSGKKN